MAGAAAVLRQDLVTLSDSLREAGLGVGSPLGEAELTEIVRAAYDPASVYARPGGPRPRRPPGGERGLGLPAPRLGLADRAVGLGVAKGRSPV